MKLPRAIAAAVIVLLPSSALASEAMNRFISLYEELLTFKDTAEFREVGYGTCCRYAKWAEKVKSFNRKASLEVMVALEAVPMDLWMIGSDHFSRDPATRKEAVERLTILGKAIRLHQSSNVAGDGEGTVTMTDPACEDVSVLIDFADAMMEEKYAEAGNVLDSALDQGECHRVQKGTIVSGPHDEREGRLGRLIEIALPDGSKVWTMDSNVEFEGQ